MPKCTQSPSEKFNFGRIGRKAIVANFDGGDLGSDGGLLLLKAIDEKIGLTRAAAQAVVDRRNPDLIEHPMQSLIAQRIYALCCGYEDLNDHDRLRHDLLLQTALGRDELLGSSPTLCRMENRASSSDAAGLARVLFEQFIAAHAEARKAPDQIVLGHRRLGHPALWGSRVQRVSRLRSLSPRRRGTSPDFVTCRSTSSVAIICWQPICATAALMGRRTPPH